MTTIDPAAIFDGNTRQFEKNYKATVAAALPADICPTDEFWRELAAVVEGYFIMTERRTHRPPKRELKYWQRITDLVDELDRELRALHRQPLWVERSARALQALHSVKDLAEAHSAGAEALSGKIRNPKKGHSNPWKGRSNPHRKFLYGAVLDLWRGLDQELRYSRKEKPAGPLIRFFTACVGPILGDKMPTAYGIAAIIDSEKARIAAYATSSLRK